MISRIIERLLEDEEPVRPEPEDFTDEEEAETAKELHGPPLPTAVNLSGDIWGNEALLKKAFTWLSKCRLGPKFGSMPIGYYQQDQVKAIDKLKQQAQKKGIDLKFARWRNGLIQAYDEGKRKWVTLDENRHYEAQEEFNDADDEEADIELWKEVTADYMVIPENPRWWRYRNTSKWKYLEDPEWEISSEIFHEGRVSIPQFKRPFGSQKPYDEGAMFEILSNMVGVAGKSAMEQIVVTLFLGEGYEEMQSAIQAVEERGLIKSVRRSGMAVYGDIAERTLPWFREALEDFGDEEEFDASQAQDVRDVDAHTLDDMKAAEPGFFDRKNNKFFGTKKIYQYGHFLVLKNRQKRHGHFGNIDYHTSYVIYEFAKTKDNPQGILLHRGSAGELSVAKEMIKLKDYRSRYERARDMVAQMGKPPVAESEEYDDDFDAELAKEIGTPDPMPNWRDHNVLRETGKFALVTFQNGKTGLVCLVPNHSPERVLVRRPEDIKYLVGLSDKEFEMSAVLEYGCGVWAVSDAESEEIEGEVNGG